ncbi:hypothetical protein CYL31_04985 [Marinomonas sp. A3A]|uniref:type III secretion system chaperone n=1 Tax=Marinomonas sp. A3A TaxID=2065312 RepID=UPI001BB2FEC3|nr:type III secretion system chaperone [Marinomonas sp. A3A]QUX90796.1 hypothetical protein CYL31_04985 [Marinomonas sp. A3A]
MTETQLKAEQLIKNFGGKINTPLSLENGVCAIYDLNNQEQAIIEVPEHSENIILHCTIIKITADISVQSLQKLLLLNFEVSAMQGCWLAIDEEDQICLCHILDIKKTDEKYFSNTLVGFMEKAKDVRLFVTSLLIPMQKH